MSTKQEQAVELYNAHIAKNGSISRSEGMTLLQTKLGMSVAGSSTYHSNTMKALGGTTPVKSTVHSEQALGRTKREKSTAHVTSTPDIEKSTDSRQLYSKVFHRGEEIVFIMSHYDRDDAIRCVPQTKQSKKYTENTLTFCVKGVPTDSETVSHAKAKYTLISI